VVTEERQGRRGEAASLRWSASAEKRPADNISLTPRRERAITEFASWRLSKRRYGL